jgi:hypothetical protein
MHILKLITILGLVCSSCISFPLAINSYNISSGEVQFQDDFSNPASGWVRSKDENIGNLDYLMGGYQISINQSNTILWSGPGLDFTDVQIEVDVSKIDGPDHDDFGVVCRASDKTNFYLLGISSDGYYGIGKVRNGILQLIGMKDMPPSDNIIQGQRTNHLRADCIGELLSLYVNGIHLVTVQDSQFTSGDVGVFAGTFDDPGTSVRFHKFSVLMP